MAPFKSSADDDPFIRKMKNLVGSSIKRSAGQMGDRCRQLSERWVSPVKCSAEGNYGHPLSGWMTSFKLCSTEGRQRCKLKDLLQMRLVTVRENWAQKWRCDQEVDADGAPDSTCRSEKWKQFLSVPTIAFSSVCLVLVSRYNSSNYRVGLLVPITIAVVTAILPKARADSGADDVDVLRPPRIENEFESLDDELDHPGDVKLDFDGLPIEIQGRILGYLAYEQVFQLKTVSSSIKNLAESDEFQASPSRKKPTLTACYFFIENGVWKWAGFDPSSREWRLLPPLKFLPADCMPDPDLFKEFLICAKDGLVCMNFSKSPAGEKLIVFNPLSRVRKELPLLNHRRNPVLMHILVDSVTKAYQVIVAGSSKSGDDDLSRITEVFDSRTGMWNRTGDLLGPPYALNEFQSGVYQDGKIFCIGFVEKNGEVGKGIIAYDVQEGRWSSEWMHLLHFCTSSTNLQLVENNGEVFLFSEREIDGSIEHWIDRVEWTWAKHEDDTSITCQLHNVIQRKKSGGRSLEVYPEFTCVPCDEGRLCILNSIDHTGVIYDIRDPEQSEVPLQALPDKDFRGELGFFCLNPMSFAVEPRFSSKVYHRKERLKEVEDRRLKEGSKEMPESEFEEGGVQEMGKENLECSHFKEKLS
ncbi:hypothetical protein KC19_7G110100 [Ceratodon purpureus]|uniref:F-box domain-containing protein n=1 Tax=Ceratodon purpureus TaxID=3225 RepID=A0A8T0HDF6_CERPU|nr:hypothetical protein KC19_7G110100 [Ceratodon purpureus]